MKLTRIAIAGFAAVLFAAPAHAGTKDDVRDLQARMARAEQALSAQSAATVRIGELEAQIQELTGRIEELTYELDQQNRRLDAIGAALSGGAVAGPDAAFGFPADAGLGGSGGPVALGPSDPMRMNWRAAAPVARTLPPLWAPTARPVSNSRSIRMLPMIMRRAFFFPAITPAPRRRSSSMARRFPITYRPLMRSSALARSTLRLVKTLTRLRCSSNMCRNIRTTPALLKRI